MRGAREPLFVSAVSAWEIGTLQNKNKIALSAPLPIWVDRALALPGMRFIPVDIPVALESTQLPGVFHADPADRFLVASARVRELSLVTADAQIITYGAQRLVNILKTGGNA
ncbi:MAG TPA: type II toxin-antitoxin system VapC family toxin [Methylococcus sp.]|nr:type II toxin-antitoxin system VapC family toxin [Methylococcus sp.]